ncbi:MAG: archease [Actinobacteria bacterium]|nr:archease [Actinomycetota bacterium]
MVMGMLKKFEIIDHPSDIGIRLVTESIEEFFEFSAWGMFSIMCDIERVKPAVKRVVRITENEQLSLEELLVIWLEKLLYIFEVKKMLFCKFGVNNIEICNDSTFLGAEISGEKINTLKHELTVSIKAPTYHMLKLAKDRHTGNWEGQIIFDV